MDKNFEKLSTLDKKIYEITRELEDKFNLLISNVLRMQTEYEHERTIDSYIKYLPYLFKEVRELISLAHKYYQLTSLREICHDYMLEDECRRLYNRLVFENK